MSANKPTSTVAAHPRYGSANPERVENGLWLRSIRENWAGYNLRQHLGVEFSHACQDPSLSAYRDAALGPFWSWQRFGRTSTKLPDGRVIHVAGEHEDSYDPDFCIYNDVVVEYPDSNLELFVYPKEVFPPTDFHTATLVGDGIILIGSLGYRDLRRPGETQMLRLDTRTLRIEPVETCGTPPGWISRHLAEMLDERTVLVIGGMVQTPEGYQPNRSVFMLDLAAMTWREGKHGDMAVFPVSDAVYRESKNPRYGTVNPERNSNPFWLEMLRRQWPPSRARLHFGDYAPPQPPLVLPDEEETRAQTAEARMAGIDAAIERSKLVRGMDDVIWTAVRCDALDVKLPDGRKLTIGGEIADFGDEYADPWVYNDIIVTEPDGAPEILTYPREVFPQLSQCVGAVMGGDVYIFGVTDTKYHPDRPRSVAVLRLDTSSYAIENLAVAPPPARIYLHAGCESRKGSRVIFPVARDRRTDPEMRVAFDLATHHWSGPFPHGA